MIVTRPRPPGGICSTTSMEPQRRRFMYIIGTAGLIIVLYLVYSIQNPNGGTKDGIHTKRATDALDHCTLLSPILPQPNVKNIPFWVPQYPGSDHGVTAALVMAMTGEFAASKNYYASSASQKKCFSASTITVICEQIHPITSLGLVPTHQASKFQSQWIMPLRNPLTAIPKHAQDKAEQYHNQKGQISIEYWRDFRDKWLEGAVSSWSNLIQTWKNMTEYQGVAIYLPYEQLLDSFQGPALTTRLVTVIRNAGFAVIAPDASNTTSSTDVTCLWYQAVQSHFKSSHPLYEYATDYVPEYTAAQKEGMIQQLLQLRDMYPSDEALTAILDGYVHDIRKHTVTDVAATTKPND